MSDTLGSASTDANALFQASTDADTLGPASADADALCQASASAVVDALYQQHLMMPTPWSSLQGRSNDRRALLGFSNNGVVRGWFMPIIQTDQLNPRASI